MKNSTSPNGNPSKDTPPDHLANVLAIIDVGHGNSAVLFDKKGVVVIDAGPGSALLEFLTEQNVEKIDVILLSHADQDHIAGLVALLSSGRFQFGCVRLNTDSLKESALWDDLAYELGKAHDSGDIDFQPTLVRDSSGQFDQGEVHIEILAPSSYLASKGAGSIDRNGRKLTTNSMSAVIRLSVDSKPIALFPGDIDRVALENVLEDEIDLHAPIVVFPHHGGRPGTPDSVEFTRSFCSASTPSHVVFSIGRGIHGTPRPEIVEAILFENPDARVTCSQLSEHCCDALPDTEPIHLNAVFARGRQQRKCCAGTILIWLKDQTAEPEEESHKSFIIANAPTALCMKRAST